ncbi:hypothetical protein [Paenibacillus alkalitolerans]|uniref:hypothetical protein n=1 Tax=Paenibacillus alkalitolerans TaxID=2799335 RepID=UPI0018F534EF|nr:hypothetical protein [Paenibacillus alkalitolerans]
MNKKTIWITAAALALALLSACGNADKQNDAAGEEKHGSGHETGNNEDTAGHSDGHGETNEQEKGSGHGDDHGGDGAHDSQETPGNLKASFTFDTGAAKANEQTQLSVRITDQEGKPVDGFDVNHEKLLHLIIVEHDLSFFSHIHPEYEGEGKFTVETDFPAGGEYKVFADFTPSGGSAMTLSEWVKVEGKEGEHVSIAADSKLVKEVDGKEIKLALSGAKAGEEATLTFDVRDAKTQQGIDNLEPYLGAVGHVVILSADAEKYLHVHPLDEKATGPVAEFATTFPESGTYKIWAQFQHNGKVITADYVVDVK